ncbi:hypothetical protein GGQ68_002518 [Sagittula marina]|uniref:Uncharacterized protein n=1 Tax=Sagittula marina TaxID=943940 RepID=A0A7W6GSN2_9RHOB|nr:hypothetical protein [Sagittula marina]MBB3986180.1 hypothetical protein [Sagittula marina]
MSRISLTARDQLDAQSSAEVEVLLLYLNHPSFDGPVRVSTDPTVALSYEPLMYGTRSTWIDGTPEEYLFVAAGIERPSDQEDEPASSRIVLDNFDAASVTALRQFSDFATAHLAIVLASTPDLIEYEWRDLQLMGISYGNGALSLSLSRDPIENDNVPMDSMTPQRFPALN